MPEENLVEIANITPTQVASICDHTFLHTQEYFKAKEAGDPIKEWKVSIHKFLEDTTRMPTIPYAFCVRSEEVEGVSKFIIHHPILENMGIVAVAGFPQGSRFSLRHKMHDAREAVVGGASEIDFVLNYEKFKLGCEGIKEYMVDVKEELKTMGSFQGYSGTIKKLILETSELTNNQIILACKLADEYGFDFVKTSTGYSSAGATPEHLKLMKENFSGGIKAAGGLTIDNYQESMVAMSGRDDGYIDLDPLKIRIGESSLLGKLLYGEKGEKENSNY